MLRNIDLIFSYFSFSQLCSRVRNLSHCELLLIFATLLSMGDSEVSVQKEHTLFESCNPMNMLKNFKLA